MITIEQAMNAISTLTHVQCMVDEGDQYADVCLKNITEEELDASPSGKCHVLIIANSTTKQDVE